MTFRRALGWTAFWIGTASVFCASIYIFRGPTSAVEFLTAYLVEQSLSVDNLFVFIIVFRYFSVAVDQQKKVLLWGLLGAVVLRAIFIFGGLELLKYVEWMLYVMGAFLMYLGYKVLVHRDEHHDPAKNLFVRFTRRFVPMTPQYHHNKFFSRVDHRWYATPLLLVLISIETTDVVFAFDSIPAVFAVTRDPFIVYTSNIFAIFGLRSLFFLIATIMPKLKYLKHGISSLLILVGLKLMLGHHIQIPTIWSLAIVVFILFISILLSLVKRGSSLPNMK